MTMETALAIVATLVRVFCGWTTYQTLKYPGYGESVDITEKAMMRYGKYWGLMLVNAISIICFWFIWWFPMLDEDYKFIALFLLGAYYANVAFKNWENLQGAKELAEQQGKMGLRQSMFNSAMQRASTPINWLR